MENQKIINLLGKIDTESKHFATKKWYIINDENNTNYGVDKDTGANSPDTIKYDTRVLKPNLCDYAEAYILVDDTIKATNAVNATRLALKNCAPFNKCNLEINDEHVHTAENLDIVMPMYNLIEYSDNYQDSSATLCQYKRDEPPEDDAVADLTADNSSSFKYKIKLLGNVTEVDGDAAGGRRLNVKVVVPLKYLSNLFRSLEMPLINSKIKLNLTWGKNCVLSTGAGEAVFIINDTKMYVPVVTLSKEDNKDFIEQQNKGFQRSICWNECKTKEQEENANANNVKYILLDPSFQGVNRLFVLAYGIKNFNKDELLHELLLTTRQNTKLRNAINNNLATDIKLNKAQIKKLIQSGGFLGKLLSKITGPLMKVALPLAKNVLAPLGLTAAMSAIDGRIQIKIHDSGIKLIIEQEDMNDIMKIVEALENSGILLKSVSKTI